MKADIEILGISGADGINPGKALNGENTKENNMGQDGTNTSDDSPSRWGRGNCKQATNGENGAAGLPGLAGGDGQDGGKSPLLILKIGSINPNSNQIIVQSNGGKGGKGGNGGDGGDGAKGGNAGVNNLKCISKRYTHYSMGGIGGDGGKGNDGGKGGDSGNGGEVYVYSDQLSLNTLLVTSSNASTPGDGGAGGNGGQPGEGGLDEPQDGQPPNQQIKGNFLGGGLGKSSGGPGEPGTVAYRRLTNPIS